MSSASATDVEAEAEADIEAGAELTLVFPLVFRRGGGVCPPAAHVVTRRCAHALSTVGGLHAWLCVLRLRLGRRVKLGLRLGLELMLRLGLSVCADNAAHATVSCRFVMSACPGA